MRRKDYVAFAEVFSSILPQSKNYSDGIIRRKIINALCKVFKSDNERFDEEKFKKACNYKTLISWGR